MRCTCKRRKFPDGAIMYFANSVSNTKGESSAGILKLTENGVKVNVTAMFTIDQVQSFISAISDGVPCNLSIFAGRIADTGRSAVIDTRSSQHGSFKQKY